MELPGMTHAELLRRLSAEIEKAGSRAAAARLWGISPQLLDFIVHGQRNVGPKLLKALKLRRVRLVIHRYEPARARVARDQVVSKVRRKHP